VQSQVGASFSGNSETPRGLGFLAIGLTVLMLVVTVVAWSEFWMGPSLTRTLAYLFRHAPPPTSVYRFGDHWQWIVGCETLAFAAALLLQSRHMLYAAIVWLITLAGLAITGAIEFGLSLRVASIMATALLVVAAAGWLGSRAA
jgi:hypothetical protein